MPIGFIWQTFLETPLINFMVLLTVVSFGSFGLSILIFTIITRVVTFPLTLRTLHSTRAMQELQPRLQELQKKYSDPRRRSEETMKLYREGGVNPLGCLGSQLIQFPIFIALYQVIRITLATTPEGVLVLQSRLYNFDLLQQTVPLSTSFLLIDLGATGNIFLLVVVFASTWLQQRISSSRTAASGSAQQQQMMQMMQWMMPAMFAWFVLVVPAGLGLYWVATTVIGIVLQWVFVGPGDFTWGSLIPRRLLSTLNLAPAAAGARVPTIKPAAADGGAAEARNIDGESSGNQRSGRRTGNRAGARPARPQARAGRRRRRSRR